MAAAFKPAYDSVSWARDAVKELDAAFRGFLDSHGPEVVTDTNPETMEHVQKVRFKARPPTIFARKASEALLNARHAFDQATFTARNLTSGPSGKSIYYPWAETPTDLDQLLRRRGIHQHLWRTFHRHEPYKRSDAYPGGNDLIRTLASLANQKHTVGLTVAGSARGFTAPDISGLNVSEMAVLMPRWDFDKGEAPLLRWTGDAHIQGEYKFRFEIVFREAVFPKPVNALTALSAFIRKADEVVQTLHGACLDYVPGS